MKKIRLKKLFLGHASIRDYIVEKAIEKKQGITVEYEGMKMVIPLERLKIKFQFHRYKFLSKFGNKRYELIDFKWKPNEAR